MVYLDPLGVGVQAEETFCVARQVTHLLVRIKLFKQAILLIQKTLRFHLFFSIFFKTLVE